jgi:hypothetical protein
LIGQNAGAALHEQQSKKPQHATVRPQQPLDPPYRFFRNSRRGG